MITMRNLKFPIPHLSVILVTGGVAGFMWRLVITYNDMNRPISALSGERDKLLSLFFIYLLACLLFCVMLVVCLFFGHGFVIFGERIKKQFTLAHQGLITISPMYGLYGKELIIDLRPEIPDEFKVLPVKLKSFRLYNDLRNGPTLKYKIELWGKDETTDKCLATEKYDLVVGDVIKGWGAHSPKTVEQQLREIILPVEEKYKSYYVVIEMAIDCSKSSIEVNPVEHVINHYLKIVACVAVQRLGKMAEVSIKNAQVNSKGRGEL